MSVTFAGLALTATADQPAGRSARAFTLAGIRLGFDLVLFLTSRYDGYLSYASTEACSATVKPCCFHDTRTRAQRPAHTGTAPVPPHGIEHRGASDPSSQRPGQPERPLLSTCLRPPRPWGNCLKRLPASDDCCQKRHPRPMPTRARMRSWPRSSRRPCSSPTAGRGARFACASGNRRTVPSA